MEGTYCILNVVFRALSEFHLDQLTLKTLPALFRKNLKLPSSFCKTPIDAARDPVDVLPYIPGKVCIKLFCVKHYIMVKCPHFSVLSLSFCKLISVLDFCSL